MPGVRLLLAIACAAALGLCGCTGEFPADPGALERAARAYDADALTHSLAAIEAWHVGNDTGLAPRLRPGLAAPTLASRPLVSRCRLNAELAALWSWHDGGRGAAPLVWYHDFLSLDEAVSEYRWLLLAPLVRWDPRYLPVLSFEGEWYGVYCGAGSPLAGPVVHYFLEDSPRIVAVNLTAFMTMMAQAMETGALRWEDGAMVEDIHALSALHQRHNPGHPFPYHVPETR